MGKVLVLKDANFSANGILDNISILDTFVQYAVSNNRYFVQHGLNSFVDVGTNNTNLKRCCVGTIDISSLVNLTPFSKIRVVFKSTVDFCMCTGPQSNSVTNWHGWKGEQSVNAFSQSWCTAYNYAEFPADVSDPLFFTMNFRRKDSGDFAAGTLLTDLLEDIILIP